MNGIFEDETSRERAQRFLDEHLDRCMVYIEMVVYDTDLACLWAAKDMILDYLELVGVRVQFDEDAKVWLYSRMLDHWLWGRHQR